MGTHQQNEIPAGNMREPLYASPWIALFIILRQKLTPQHKSVQVQVREPLYLHKPSTPTTNDAR